ncbi:MAG TPA: glycoside hydrolase family 15 protein [Burkholderiales bacterium]|nr:glycoside hydrolase family 15 protein [Burkholderiales bacterium]
MRTWYGIEAFLKIEDYALIGDCHSAALVGRDGSIDWLCWPRFDSAACFAALLGTREHGRWQIAPSGEYRAKRAYRDDTLILETQFETAEGRATLIDFMPTRAEHCQLARIVVGERGCVKMDMEFILRFDYGASVPWVTRLAEGHGIRAIAGPDLVALRSSVPLRARELTHRSEFQVAEGERLAFTLVHGASHLPAPEAFDAERALKAAEHAWRRWCERCTVQGEWAPFVRRSLVTLKALTYAPTGGLVAAPTTSLPERIGGVRNWDYRFCWLRDATLTLLALMNAGYRDEALAWRDWLVRAIAGSPGQMQIMYGIGGERRLTELEIPWLPGYEDSKPVRIGNAAASQLQLDVYGEMMDAMHQARKHGVPKHAAAWDLQRALLEHLETCWQDPDEGLWEVRGPRRHFTYSKVMCWVAFDRAVKAGEQFARKGPIERWRELRDRIHAEICEKAWNAKLGSFVQSYGSEELDASLLLLPTTGFLPATDPRMRSTIEAIQSELVHAGFVLRYRTQAAIDGLPPGEGVFLACSFWLADCLILLGRHDEARALFERLCRLTNDVGLLAEEYDPAAQRQLGNFPQAFSHVALVNTAMNLSRGAKPVEQRAEKKVA